MPNNQGFKVPIEVKWFVILRKRENALPTKIISQVKNKFNRRITFDIVRRLWAKYLRTGDVKDLKSSGRPKALNSREERFIARMFQNQPGLSVKWATINILINSKPVKRTTMRRTLRGQGLIPKTSERGKEILRRNKIKRVAFARDHKNWGENDWASIIFSDESQLFPMRTVSAVSWVRKGEPANQPEEENLRNKNIRVWAYIAYNGDRRIHRFQETMTSIKYKRLLELNVLNLMARRGHRNRPLIFMQDGASCHMSNDVMNWFTQNGIKTLR